MPILPDLPQRGIGIAHWTPRASTGSIAAGARTVARSVPGQQEVSMMKSIAGVAAGLVAWIVVATVGNVALRAVHAGLCRARNPR